MKIAVNRSEIELTQGDITESDSDAIVNALIHSCIYGLFVNFVAVLGVEGLVGLIAVGVIWAILKIYRCNTIIKRPIKQIHFYKSWI